MTKTLEQVQTALQDIGDPFQPSLWPPPWYFWALMLGLAIGLLIYLWRRYTKQGPYWYKSAVQQVKRQCQKLEGDDPERALLELNHILKRVALTTFEREQVAHLHSDSWCHWLDQQGQCNHFTQGIGQCLGAHLYNPKTTWSKSSSKQLQTTMLDWLELHKDTHWQPPGQAQIRRLIMHAKSISQKSLERLKMWREQRRSKAENS